MIRTLLKSSVIFLDNESCQYFASKSKLELTVSATHLRFPAVNPKTVSNQDLELKNTGDVTEVWLLRHKPCEDNPFTISVREGFLKP